MHLRVFSLGYTVYSTQKFRNMGRTLRENISAVSSSAMQPQKQHTQTLEIFTLPYLIFKMIVIASLWIVTNSLWFWELKLENKNWHHYKVLSLLLLSINKLHCGFHRCRLMQRFDCNGWGRNVLFSGQHKQVLIETT